MRVELGTGRCVEVWLISRPEIKVQIASPITATFEVECSVVRGLATMDPTRQLNCLRGRDDRPVPAAHRHSTSRNIALAVIILLTALQVQSPLEFSLFPSVLLLAATLGRLVLNISTTRLILSSGADGTGAAGNIIQSLAATSWAKIL